MKRFVQENVKPRLGVRAPPGASQHEAAGHKAPSGVPLNSYKKKIKEFSGHEEIKPHGSLES